MRPKTLVTCCQYTAAQGTPAPWTCPGCGTEHTEHIPEVPDAPEPYVPVPPGTAMGAEAALQNVRGVMPGL